MREQRNDPKRLRDMKGAINKNLRSQTIPDVVLSLLGAGEKIAEGDLNAREAHYRYLAEKSDEFYDENK